MKTFLVAAAVTVLAGCATSDATTAKEVVAPVVIAPTTMMSITVGNTAYSARSQPALCEKSTTAICQIDAIIVAAAVDNGELLWERRIYFQSSTDGAEPLKAIPVNIMQIKGKKVLRAQNARGDSFELDVKLGHMKKPKEPREYKATAKP